MKNTVDLRSDTVTRPTREMMLAMIDAEVGDDVFGEDPSINRLQEKVAGILGKEAALYVPSGTMANQIAMACHTRPGDEVYCPVGCHARNYEAGAPAALSGVSLCSIEGARGAFTAEDVALRLRPEDDHFPVSSTIWVENSANRAGGAIFPQDEILKLRRLADEHGLGMHLDGARLWNVAAATGTSETELAESFDSVSVCLSKGLGCPVGSLVSGSREFIRRAHRFRKRFGGGMRQAGYLAAAGLYALDHHRKRMADDHARARRIAETVHSLPSFKIDLDSVATNIVIFDVSPSGQSGSAVEQTLAREGVLCLAFGSMVRMVTHLDVDDEGIDRAVDALRKRFG